MAKNDFVKENEKYIRVGTDYFKIIKKPDRFNIVRIELKKWTKEAIRDDHENKYFIKSIPKFDDFIIEPDNLTSNKNGFKSLYNMYSKFPHLPKSGNWKWTKILLEHIFGEQYKLGIKYLLLNFL